MKRDLTDEEADAFEHHRWVYRGLVAQARERKQEMARLVREIGGPGASVDLNAGTIEIPDAEPE